MNKLNIKLPEEVNTPRELVVAEKIAKPTHVFLAEYKNEQVPVEASCFEQLNQVIEKDFGLKEKY